MLTRVPWRAVAAVSSRGSSSGSVWKKCPCFSRGRRGGGLWSRPGLRNQGQEEPEGGQPWSGMCRDWRPERDPQEEEEAEAAVWRWSCSGPGPGAREGEEAEEQEVTRPGQDGRRLSLLWAPLVCS